MQTPSAIDEARRQIEICNACRYCEGYCSVFPAVHRARAFSAGDITQFANLCHNCRGCYYACQYTAPHEFDLNLPKALAEVRQESWQEYAWPRGFAKAFHKSGTAIGIALALGIAAIFLIAKMLGEQAGGEGFYAILSHSAMVAIFLPAFILPIITLVVSMRRYWRAIGGGMLVFSDVKAAFNLAADMKNLSGGHGVGCNFEDEDRFTQGRRYVHQAVMYGFLLCFASTSVATLMHYVFNMPAPYGLFSLPKLFGLSGGVLLSLGTLAMMLMKRKGDKNLGDARVWGGEMGFIALLFLVSTSGLLLYVLGGTALLAPMLAFHLGAVLAFFLITPYSKMAHGFYRLAALLKETHNQRLSLCNSRLTY
ncbi:MAG: tricarballylate utilization 4Fe-4S protein TcuB [Hyphomicrobiales bacterium]